MYTGRLELRRSVHKECQDMLALFEMSLVTRTFEEIWKTKFEAQSHILEQNQKQCGIVPKLNSPTSHIDLESQQIGEMEKDPLAAVSKSDEDPALLHSSDAPSTECVLIENLESRPSAAGLQAESKSETCIKPSLNTNEAFAEPNATSDISQCLTCPSPDIAMINTCHQNTISTATESPSPIVTTSVRELTSHDDISSSDVVNRDLLAQPPPVTRASGAATNAANAEEFTNVEDTALNGHRNVSCKRPGINELKCESPARHFPVCSNNADTKCKIQCIDSSTCQPVPAKKPKLVSLLSDQVKEIMSKSKGQSFRLKAGNSMKKLRVWTLDSKTNFYQPHDMDTKASVIAEPVGITKIIKPEVTSERTIQANTSISQQCKQCTARFENIQAFRTHVCTGLDDKENSPKRKTQYLLKSSQDSKQSTLVSRLEVDTGTRADFPFECNMCSMRFKLPNELSSHLKSIHAHSKSITDNYGKSSPVCNQYVMDHLARKHHQVKHVQCEFCDSTFANIAALYKHTEVFHQVKNDRRRVKVITPPVRRVLRPILPAPNTVTSPTPSQTQSDVESWAFGDLMKLEDSEATSAIDVTQATQDMISDQPLNIVPVLDVHVDGPPIAPEGNLHFEHSTDIPEVKHEHFGNIYQSLHNLPSETGESGGQLHDVVSELFDEDGTASQFEHSRLQTTTDDNGIIQGTILSLRDVTTALDTNNLVEMPEMGFQPASKSLVPLTFPIPNKSDSHPVLRHILCNPASSFDRISSQVHMSPRDRNLTPDHVAEDTENALLSPSRYLNRHDAASSQGSQNTQSASCHHSNPSSQFTVDIGNMDIFNNMCKTPQRQRCRNRQTGSRGHQTTVSSDTIPTGNVEIQTGTTSTAHTASGISVYTESDVLLSPVLVTPPRYVRPKSSNNDWTAEMQQSVLLSTPKSSSAVANDVITLRSPPIRVSESSVFYSCTEDDSSLGVIGFTSPSPPRGSIKFSP